MSFSEAVQWWEDWQLRLLVLASLFFQYFLFAAAVVRKLRVPHWFRALIWLAYQGGDVVAVYALATLFIRHKEEALASAHLETLWAPILLIHLGGQDGITAYSTEDNENWRRHLLVSVSQISIAIYVFRKSWWSGDVILLRAAILLFIPGILKCLEKPWALKNATVASITNSSDSRVEETLESLDAQQQDIKSQQDYVQAAAKAVANPGTNPPVEDDLADQPYHLVVDRGHPYSIRLQNLRVVALRCARAEPAHVHQEVDDLVLLSLSKAFNRLYTKHKAGFCGLLRAAVALVTFVGLGLFQRRHRGGVYDRADVLVTYVLLGCTGALELVSACLVLAPAASGLSPDDKLAQYNLVGYLARNEKHPWFWALARLLGARVLLDRLRCTAPPQPSCGVTRLVYEHVAAGWKECIWKSLPEQQDAATGESWKPKPTLSDGVRAYRLFNDSRGRRTLELEGCRRVPIEESLRRPFDEAVLLWHLATEFCYFDHVDTGHDPTRHSRMLSNYMAYLLFLEPEMLIPGARSNLFRATYHELRKMLKPLAEDEDAIELEPTGKKAPPPRSGNEMVRKLIQKVKRTISVGSEDLVHKAWAIAHELMEFAKEKNLEFIRSMEEEEKSKLAELVKLCMETVVGEEGNRFADLKKFENADEFTNEDLKKILMQLIQKKVLMQIMESAMEKAEASIINTAKSKAEDSKIPEEVKKAKLTELVEFAKDKEAELFDEEKMKTLDEEKRSELMRRKKQIKVNQELRINKAKEKADDKMWKVIQGVWVEMLCFSAGRCRGYLHAKSLANGGEYLSYVWLLLSYMGMETMPERMQRLEPEPPTVGDKTIPERMERPEELPVVGDTGALVRTLMDEDMDYPVGENNV